MRRGLAARLPILTALPIATASLAAGAVTALGAGCAPKPANSQPHNAVSSLSTPDGATLSTPDGATLSTPDGATAGACRDAQRATNAATAKFTADVGRAVAAGEKGDPKAQQNAMAALRVTFQDWSAALRTQADRATDPQLKAVLVEYAGAVDATISRVRTAADLETLASFDDRELDVAANRFKDVCH
jgi:hypothetical protein